MSALKFITKVSGLNRLVTAITASAGAGDANKILATGGDGKLDPSFLPPGVDLAVETMPASEDLVAGDFVNIWDNVGTRNVRLADGSTDKPAHGFVLAGAITGANAAVYTRGVNNQLVGLTPGARYFLSDTAAGEATLIAPAETSGHIFQVVGPALSATAIQFEYDDPVYVA